MVPWYKAEKDVYIKECTVVIKDRGNRFKNITIISKVSGNKERIKQSKDINKLLIKSYFKSTLPRRNYRKIMYAIWNEICDFTRQQPKNCLNEFVHFVGWAL